MEEIAVSLCASANRPVLQNGFKNWERFLNSLKRNKVKYEVIFSGDVPPNFDTSLYPEFKWIKSNVKPAQAYQICFWEAKGELIGYSADDADYVCNNPDTHTKQFDNLDIAYNFYKECEKRYNDNKTIVAMNPCEDGGWPQEKWHYFFGGNPWSPRMAPFGLIHRDFMNEIGGYPNDHISGQAENSVVMSAYMLSGRVEFCKNACLYVHHREVHPRKDGKEVNLFRRWYNEDRRALENRWVKEGYGKYEKLNSEQLKNTVHISNTPLVPIMPFKKTDNVRFVSQGIKGQW